MNVNMNQNNLQIFNFVNATALNFANIKFREFLENYEKNYDREIYCSRKFMSFKVYISPYQFHFSFIIQTLRWPKTYFHGVHIFGILLLNKHNNILVLVITNKTSHLCLDLLIE